ncbi:MAG: Crp/Fnr family transcriptional regulator [Chitinophagales bacterium]|jgi:CRP-like cAMP-binding protein|nr:Crp/Fnr family transcriptional regulator [Chitinophagales bacterium]HNL05953.1 cyclic nucleotide-binding domain-containing protein [Chitinophagales bacterium]
MDNFKNVLESYKLSAQDIGLIKQIAIAQNIKTYKTLVDYGEKCQHIYFILKGGFVMQLIKEDDGSERTVNFFLDNFQPFMTVPQSFFRDVPSNCKLMAIKNSDILVFPKQKILQLAENNLSVKSFYQDQIIQALLNELDFRMKLLSLSPPKMYKLLITDYQEIIQNVSSRHIANFIGISPEWLSNLKRTL